MREKQFGADVLVGLGMVVTNLVETALPALINDLAELSHRLVLVCSMTPATDR